MKELKTWRKSSYSGGNGGDCVEVADTVAKSSVRDTTRREAEVLTFPRAEWAAFLRDVRDDAL